MATPEARPPSLFKTLVASTVGGWGYGALAALLSHPLDTVKTRQQVLQSVQSPSSSSRSLLHGLYRGIVPAVSASVLFRAVPFTAFEAVKGFLTTPASVSKQVAQERRAGTDTRTQESSWNWNDHSVLVAAFGGAAGGLARASLEFPFEAAKVRAQTETANARGIKDFMRGFTVTAVRNVTVIAGFWTFMELSKDLREQVAPRSDWPRSNAFLAGGGCSVAAWALIYPFDVIKSNVQAQRSTGLHSRSAELRGWQLCVSQSVCLSVCVRERGVCGCCLIWTWCAVFVRPRPP